MFEDIIVTPLSEIRADGGNVMHAMKNRDAGFNGFGEAYFSWVDYLAIKAWKKHNSMVMNLIVPVGEVKFIFFSDTKNKFRSEIIGQNRYSRITVPPGTWFGFKGLSNPKSLVLNLANLEHDPLEVDRKLVDEIVYAW
jgi:dTDP-4-dehydrorhamnose 3,5-epimerase